MILNTGRSAPQLIASLAYTCSTSMEVLTGNNPQYADQVRFDT